MSDSEPTTAKPQSCMTCINLVRESEVPKRYGKATGTAMCAKYDKPIGTAATRELKAFTYVADKTGKNCKGYNAPVNDRPARTFRVAFPDINADAVDATKPDGDPRVNTCMSCRHFAPSEVVMSEWGWATGACGLKGELVPEGAATFVGRKCAVSDFGPNRASLLGVTLLPEYDEEYLTPDLVAAFLSDVFDPATYPTDKPLTADDKAAGIRAWKKIVDKERPDFDTNVFLPIYDLTRWDENTQRKVPKAGDDEHPEDYLDHNNALYKIAVLWTELDETPALWGPAGVGKTELFRHIAWQMQLPFERISVTASTELDDLAGKMHFDAGKGTFFQYGRIPDAWRRPGIILLDEPNVGQPDVWQFLRPLTDNSKQLVLDMNEGERIDRNVDAFMGMAMNPAWDPRNVGAATIGDADGSRLMHLYMDLPPEQIEEQIIVTRCQHDGYTIAKPMLKTVMAIAKELRGMCDQGTLPMSWGIRPNVKVARATRWFSLTDAYRVAVADFLEPQQAEIVLDIVKAHNVSTPNREKTRY